MVRNIISLLLLLIWNSTLKESGLPMLIVPLSSSCLVVDSTVLNLNIAQYIRSDLFDILRHISFIYALLLICQDYFFLFLIFWGYPYQINLNHINLNPRFPPASLNLCVLKYWNIQGPVQSPSLRRFTQLSSPWLIQIFSQPLFNQLDTLLDLPRGGAEGVPLLPRLHVQDLQIPTMLIG